MIFFDITTPYGRGYYRKSMAPNLLVGNFRSGGMGGPVLAQVV